jgi:hypothetical protein
METSKLKSSTGGQILALRHGGDKSAYVRHRQPRGDIGCGHTRVSETVTRLKRQKNALSMPVTSRGRGVS